MRAWWIAGLLLVPMLVPAPASALSCVPLVEQTPYSSFTGTLVQQRGDAYLFAVREVWSGPELQARTWIRFDELWYEPVPTIGEAWVVYADEASRANTCTMRPEGDGADDLRPEEVRKPTQATWWSAIRTSLTGTTLLLGA